MLVGVLMVLVLLLAAGLFLVIRPSGGARVQVRNPPAEYAESWDVYIDTAGTPDAVEVLKAGSTFTMKESSTLVLREYVPQAPDPDHSVAASVAAASSRG